MNFKKLWSVSESNNHNESFQKTNRLKTFSTYFEAKNECSRLLAYYLNYKIHFEDRSQTSGRNGVHCSELYGCYPEKDDHELIGIFNDEQKQKS